MQTWLLTSAWPELGHYHTLEASSDWATTWAWHPGLGLWVVCGTGT